jgi:hypothetical protein
MIELNWRIHMKKMIALAALAVASVSASAATNLFTDGSFESISQSAGTWNTYNTVAGWTVTQAGFLPSSHGLEIRNDVAGVAQDGHNFIELDGYENDRITQSFATTVGQAYEISFWYQNRDGVAASSEGFDAVVLSGGVSSASLVGNAASNGWLQEKIVFTAGSSFTTFTVVAAGASDSLGTSFDNFSAVAVPEPATMGLFAAGLAMLGLSTRRRRQ